MKKKEMGGFAKGFFMVLCLLVLCVLPFFGVFCDETRDIGSEELKRLIDENAPLVVVDTRTDYEFQRGHIAGAISIPQDKFNAMETFLPKEKDIPCVFYCRGYG